MFGELIGYKLFQTTYKGVSSNKVAISIREDEAGWQGDHAITITGNCDKIGNYDYKSLLGHIVAVDTNTYNGVEYIKKIAVIK